MGSENETPVGVPSGWQDVIVETAKAAVVAFTILLLKEYFETAEWDVPACLVDAAWVGGAMFVANTALALSNAGARPRPTAVLEPPDRRLRRQA